MISASISTGIPSSNMFEDYYELEGKQDKQLNFSSYITDNNFLTTMGLNLSKEEGLNKGVPIPRA